MNKLLSVTLLVGGLMLLGSPNANAHKNKRHHDQPPTRYYSDGYGRDDYRRDSRYRRDFHHYDRKHKRRSEMPRWLRHKKSFRRWYRHSSFRNNRRLSWHELFDIYRWERRRYYYRNY